MTLLTHEGPYGDFDRLWHTVGGPNIAGDILNVSIFGGFVFSDSAKNGLAIVVTARHDLDAARKLAREIAEKALG